MTKNIITRWLTNFDADQVPVYEEAIRIFEKHNPLGPKYYVDSPELRDVDNIGDDFCPDPSNKGLYFEGPAGTDNGAFLSVVDAVRAKMKTKSKNEIPSFKILAVYFFGDEKPKYICDYSAMSSIEEPIMTLSFNRSDAFVFAAEEVNIALHYIRNAIARKIVGQSTRILGVFGGAHAVMIEDATPADPPQMKFAMLKKIVRLKNPDQTVEFVERVDSWLTQWTVANNFEPRVTHDVNNALRDWFSEFRRSFYTAVGTRLATKLESQFGFVYTMSDVAFDRPFYLNNCNIEIDCKDIPKVA